VAGAPLRSSPNFSSNQVHRGSESTKIVLPTVAAQRRSRIATGDRRRRHEVCLTAASTAVGWQSPGKHLRATIYNLKTHNLSVLPNDVQDSVAGTTGITT
jgi:hypothetical protein